MSTLTPIETPLEALPLASCPLSGLHAVASTVTGAAEVQASADQGKGWSRFQAGSGLDLAPLPKPRFSLASPMPAPLLPSPPEEGKGTGSARNKVQAKTKEVAPVAPLAVAPPPSEIDFDSIVREVAKVCQQAKIPPTPSNIQVITITLCINNHML